MSPPTASVSVIFTFERLVIIVVVFSVAASTSTPFALPVESKSSGHSSRRHSFDDADLEICSHLGAERFHSSSTNDADADDDAAGLSADCFDSSPSFGAASSSFSGEVSRVEERRRRQSLHSRTVQYSSLLPFVQRCELSRSLSILSSVGELSRPTRENPGDLFHADQELRFGPSNALGGLTKRRLIFER